MKLNSAVALGIDVGLGETSTLGIGVNIAGKVHGFGIRGMKPPPHDTFCDVRIRLLADRVIPALERHRPHLVLLERPVSGNKQAVSFPLRWLYGAVMYNCMRFGAVVLTLSSQTIRRLYLGAGMGGVKKEVALAEYRKRHTHKKHDVVEAMAYADLAGQIAAGKFVGEPAHDAYKYFLTSRRLDNEEVDSDDWPG